MHLVAEIIFIFLIVYLTGSSSLNEKRNPLFFIQIFLILSDQGAGRPEK